MFFFKFKIIEVNSFLENIVEIESSEKDVNKAKITNKPKCTLTKKSRSSEKNRNLKLFLLKDSNISDKARALNTSFEIPEVQK